MVEKVYFIDEEAYQEIDKTLKENPYEEGSFARQGYVVRDAKSLLNKGKGYYLYIDAPEEFFEKNEEKILSIEGVEEVKDRNKVKEIIDRIRREEESAEEGVGAIFK